MKKALLLLLLITFLGIVFAQNPFIKGQFTADPSARVFNGKVFVFYFKIRSI